MYIVEVSLKNIIYNVGYIKRKTGVPVCAVLKANAYGHGLTEVAYAVQPFVKCFAVATLDEALLLAESGIERDIIILGESDINQVLPPGVVPSVSSVNGVLQLKSRCGRAQVKINTGMNRFGCKPDELAKLLKTAKKTGVSIDGIFSHFYDAPSADATKAQYSEFIKSVKKLNGSVPLHICASNCLFLPQECYLSYVRTGLAMYGYGDCNLKNSIRVYGHVLWVKKIRKGEHIGYGDTVAERDMKICTVSFGYADCIRRSLIGVTVTINNKKCKTVGVSCMDVTSVDVSGVDCKVGDKAYLIQSADDVYSLAAAYNTVPYEILTSLNGRRKTVYVDG